MYRYCSKDFSNCPYLQLFDPSAFANLETVLHRPLLYPPLVYWPVFPPISYEHSIPRPTKNAVLAVDTGIELVDESQRIITLSQKAEATS